MSKTKINDETTATYTDGVIILWAFKCLIYDRREQITLNAAAVELGTDDYDIEQAIANIRRKYDKLGYELVEAQFKCQKHIEFNSLQLFNELPDDANGEKPHGGVITAGQLLTTGAKQPPTTDTQEELEELEGE